MLMAKTIMEISLYSKLVMFPKSSQAFTASVKEVVIVTKRKKLFQWFNRNDEESVKTVLSRLNIEHLIDKNIAELSVDNNNEC